MLPRWHLLWGFFISYILIYFFHFPFFAGAVIFVSSILLDLDHIIVYFLETKNLHPLKFFEWHAKQERFLETLSKEKKKKYRHSHYLFHGLEVLLLLALFSFFNKLVLLILYGVLIHLVLDIAELYSRGFHISCKVSQIWLWQRNKKKRRVSRLCSED